ncbi:hypothetical protein EV702DRAFT_680938 [Suillus placidus]|uniref:DUF6533 domain-containing protein n=1 Tax=Suillus placidus TaxID=48579 RepID=A0A9P7A1J7_9AGAM|nr:hypothetical protein EV702DRAFT_680938 [Suillus placidus]
MDNNEAQQILMHSYAVLVASTTLTEEITFIWYRPKALSAMLFLLNRYVALLGNMYALLINFLPVPEERFQLCFSNLCFFCSTKPSCPKYLLSRELLIFGQQFIVCFILTLRTYALYGRSQRLLIWMVVVVIALAGVASAGIFGHSSSTVIVVPGVNCFESDIIVTPANPGLAWVALFAYELLIFVLTVSRICKTRGLLRSPSLIMSRKNIIDVIFQDGAMYFGAMTLSNIPNILTFYFGSDIDKTSLATFTSCMSVTLVSRLMLNLHKSINSGIFATLTQDDNHDSYILTTRVSIHAQSLISY